MLNRKFRNSTYFIDRDMTIKQFLDYVLNCYGDWTIIKKPIIATDKLFELPDYEYYLTCYDGSRTRGRYKLGEEERAYLSEHSEFFKERLVA